MSNGSLTFVDWFSGVGGCRLGLTRAGHRCVWSCEIDDFARRVYQARFGRAPEARDINQVTPEQVPHADLWVGGFPCQDLSSAGKRKGLKRGTRSGLVWKLLELAAVRKPRWLLLENVLGLLSIDKGKGFGRLLDGLAEAGYTDVAWRVLDARWHGVAQRRRRVFVLAGRAGAGAGAGEVLLEPARGPGDPPPGRSPWPEAAGGAEEGAGGDLGAGLGDEHFLISPPLGTPGVRAGHRCDPFEGGGALVVVPGVADTLTTGGAGKRGTSAAGRRQEDDRNLVVLGAFNSTAESGRGGNGWDPAVSPPVRVGSGVGIPSPPAVVLRRRGGPPEPGWVAFHVNAAMSTARKDHAFQADHARCLDTTGGFAASQGGTVVMGPAPEVWQCHGTNVGPLASLRTGHNETSGVPFTLTSVGVRRLTPLECERLMGFPDRWTDVEGATDSARYRACGNSVAVPVLAGIGRRLARAEAAHVESVGLPPLPGILAMAAADPRDARRRVARWVAHARGGAADDGILRLACERAGCWDRSLRTELQSDPGFERVGAGWRLTARGRQEAIDFRTSLGLPGGA